jgi:ubiquinone/menaquinone biosynthesis C-methylase UbiE/uncharacterized membrane protein YbhN (UPF0104 family)
VWLVLAACAVAVLVVGIVTTLVILAGVQPRAAGLPLRFWTALGVGALATCLSLGLRTVRWIFLLRRTDVRIPIRDACIGYLSGLCLLFVPLLIGEVVVRAAVQRARAGVPIATTAVVSLWERLIDIVALALIAAVGGLLVAGSSRVWILLAVVAAASVPACRRLLLSATLGVVNTVVSRVSSSEQPARRTDFDGLAATDVWLPALAASVGLWTLPGLAFWSIIASLTPGFGLAQAQSAYAGAALTGGLFLAPGGVRVVGTTLILDLAGAGVAAGDAAIAALSIRLVTAGLAVTLGAVFAWLHLRTRAIATAEHFDEIAHAYDVQIPRAQRESLLARKTEMMRSEIERFGVGGRGLDVGCGQGWYVARMRELGFDVHGIDASAGQVALARRHVDAEAIDEGTALTINAVDESFDFLYCINVLHHLPSFEDQRAAFVEFLRVLRPGGLIFVHEINTRNVLFRFYMGYVFPSVKCIDEGTERWLLPHRMNTYTDAPVVSSRYFTFMPEFVPVALLRLLQPIERLLETSALNVYSAHYMTVLRKPGHGV